MTTARLVILIGALCAATAVIVAASGPEAPAAQGGELEERFSRGWQSYQRYCQNCHGEEGRGDGRIASWLTVQPADLTQLSERNGGAFPEERVIEVMDGRREVELHGAREMPIWGEVFRNGSDGEDGEAVVTERITDLVVALRSIDRLPSAVGGADEPE